MTSLNPQSIELLRGLSQQLFQALDKQDGKPDNAISYGNLKQAGVADNNVFWGFNTDSTTLNNTTHVWTQNEFEQYMMFSALQQSQANPMTWDPSKVTEDQSKAFDKTIADWTASSQAANASDIFQTQKPAFQAVSTLLKKQLTSSDASGNAPRTAVIALGTNDYLNPQTAGENTRLAIEAAKAKGYQVVIVPPNANNPLFKEVSAAVQAAAQKAEVTVESGKYDPNDPLHLTMPFAKDIGAKYPGAIYIGDSNAVRIGSQASGKTTKDGQELVDSDGKLTARVGAGTNDIVAIINALSGSSTSTAQTTKTVHKVAATNPYTAIQAAASKMTLESPPQQPPDDSNPPAAATAPAAPETTTATPPPTVAQQTEATPATTTATAPAATAAATSPPREPAATAGLTPEQKNALMAYKQQLEAYYQAQANQLYASSQIVAYQRAQEQLAQQYLARYQATMQEAYYTNLSNQYLSILNPAVQLCSGGGFSYGFNGSYFG